MNNNAPDAGMMDVAELAAFLHNYPKALVLTGAGMSTASGIPDYRDQNGVRRGQAPIQGPEFRRTEAVRKRYWARSMLGWPTLARTSPNAGHRAIAELEAAGNVSTVLTQNVDGLHQQAGSANVIELHGNIHAVVCLNCRTQFSRSAIQSLLEHANPDLIGAAATALPDGDAQFEPDALAEFHIPSCEHCGGMLQPDVVFFGDGVPRARTEAAEQALAQADALLVVGSSLIVFSGYRFCRMAAETGKPIAAINRGVTRADHLLSLKSETASEITLPALAQRMRAISAHAA
ncbi:NAD-dependent protein deacetylase [Undibacterium sp.]|jgi:NAD-dependent SIR2 family protein deacetylase|uniref:NAD-dependent protein deacetylase n=1 Tax=Undibacterium sp. TaxID=1914977 RepID=UPI002CCEB9E8|nr:NAD-dependent protein deacetylase [Undibacterium sp.]HTD02651.1 NAD-dependent protein deacetylase [Undibacterium sp.]